MYTTALPSSYVLKAVFSIAQLIDFEDLDPLSQSESSIIIIILAVNHPYCVMLGHRPDGQLVGGGKASQMCKKNVAIKR